MPSKKLTQEDEQYLHRYNTRKTSYKEWVFFILTGIYVSAIPICMQYNLLFMAKILSVSTSIRYCEHLIYSLILASGPTASNAATDWWIVYCCYWHCYLSSCFCVSKHQAPSERSVSIICYYS